MHTDKKGTKGLIYVLISFENSKSSQVLTNTDLDVHVFTE